MEVLSWSLWVVMFFDIIVFIAMYKAYIDEESINSIKAVCIVILMSTPFLLLDYLLNR